MATNCPGRQPHNGDTWIIAIAELELGICHIQVQPSEHAISLLQHASAELRHLSVNLPSPPGDTTISLYQARRAQAALIREFQRLERSAEAAEAARHMADWLSEITLRVSDDAIVHRSLQLAQTENVGLLVGPASPLKPCRHVGNKSRSGKMFARQSL